MATLRAAVSDVRPGAYRVLALVAAAHAVNHAYTALLPILYPAMMAASITRSASAPAPSGPSSWEPSSRRWASGPRST
jgi:hypothetical protein